MSMLAMPLVSVRRSPIQQTGILGAIGLCIGLLLTGCNLSSQSPPAVSIRLYQQWELQPGDTIGGRQVLGGLGDISIALNGSNTYAPFAGKTQLDQRRCVLFSSPQVPAYLFRLCGLPSPNLGELNQGDIIGSGESLQFATLRKQPNGTWAIVEPAKSLLEKILNP